MVLREVFPYFLGARAGLQQGDCVVAVEGQAISSGLDWGLIRANFEVGSPRRLDIERGDKRLQFVVTPGRRSLSGLDHPDLNYVLVEGNAAVCLLLGLVIAFSRPHDAVALLGAWLLAATAVGSLPGYGLATAWRHLPAPLGILLWIGLLSNAVVGPLCFSFFAVFPRKLLGSPWPLRLVWSIGVIGVIPPVLETYRMLYLPQHAAGTTRPMYVSPVILMNMLILGGLAALVVNYRHLHDLNERRRVRVLVLGTVVGVLGYLPTPIIGQLFPTFSPTFFSTPAPIVSDFLFLLVPVSFAYALLRHRLFDIRVMLRQGLQYALARGFVLSTVPVLATILFAGPLAAWGSATWRHSAGTRLDVCRLGRTGTSGVRAAQELAGVA